MYATGDLSNNFNKLRREAKSIKYHNIIDPQKLTNGDLVPLLQLLHYSLLDYSAEIAEMICRKGYNLNGVADKVFIHKTLRLLCNEFDYNPHLTANQFMSTHFLERKLIVVCEAIKRIRKKHIEIKQSNERKNAKWFNPLLTDRSSTQRMDAWTSPNLIQENTRITPHVATFTDNGQVPTWSTAPLSGPWKMENHVENSVGVSLRSEEVDTKMPMQVSDAAAETNTGSDTLDIEKMKIQDTESTATITKKEPQLETLDVKEIQLVLEGMENKLKDLANTMNAKFELMEMRLGCIERRLPGKPDRDILSKSLRSEAQCARSEPTSPVARGWPPREFVNENQ